MDRRLLGDALAWDGGHPARQRQSGRDARGPREGERFEFRNHNRVAPMPYRDLREFIADVDALRSLRRIAVADPHHQICAITDVAAGMSACPAQPFDSL